LSLSTYRRKQGEQPPRKDWFMHLRSLTALLFVTSIASLALVACKAKEADKGTTMSASAETSW
jgi:hypothetical protein